MRERLTVQENPVDLLKPHKQAYNFSCGPASLHMLLECHDVTGFSEEDILKVMATGDEGTSWQDVHEFLDRIRISYVYRANASYKKLLDDFNFHRSPILVMWRTDRVKNIGYHFSVVKDVIPNELLLADPTFGDYYPISKNKFLRRWLGEPGKTYLFLDQE